MGHVLDWLAYKALPYDLLRRVTISRPASWYLRTRSLRKVHLPQIDNRPIPPRGDEIRMFVCVRNEAVLLPRFFEHYRNLGVQRFFVVDNVSTDGTRELVLGQADAHLFEAAGSYAEAEVGMEWIRHMLYRYGSGGWCVLADADEFLVYPRMDELRLRDLCAHIDSHQRDALECILLDMYSAGPVRDAVYSPGQNPLEVCPMFDPASHYLRNHFGTPAPMGGVRHRIFGRQVCLRKVPLIKVTPQTYVHTGYHAAWGARVADLRGVMLHFKFFSTFHETAQREAARGEHFRGGSEYKAYLEVLQKQPNLSLACSDSVRYEGERQLSRFNLMKNTPEWREYSRISR